MGSKLRLGPGRTGVRALGVALAIAATTTFTPLSAMAQDPAENGVPPDSPGDAETPRVTNGMRFGSWVVACEAIAVNETTCVLRQRLVRSADNTFLAELVAFWDRDMKQAFLAGRVPIGAYFPSGFVMRTGEAETRYEFAWQSCSQDACEALLQPESETLATIDGAGEAILGYRPAMQAEPLVFRTRMNGLVEGLDRLKAALARQ